MHDIKWIRDNPELFDRAMHKRGLAQDAHGENALSTAALSLDEERRGAITRLQELQTKRNEVAKAIGKAKGQGEEASELLTEAASIKAEIEKLQQETEGGGALENLLATLPNIPADDVPDGKDEDANQELRTEGEKPSFSFAPKQHFDLGEGLGQMDFEQAAKVSGARFVYLTGQLAKLERALAQFMLDLHTSEFGFLEVVPPYLVRDKALYGTGQLPKFEEDLFKTTTDHYLIPTAEVVLANLAQNKILDIRELPLRLTAYTPCFRSEAGSAGRDTRGMIRQHQFTKVELFSIVAPEESKAEHERMLSVAEEVLKRLGLHYRVMLLCAGDMGFSAEKTYDLEVWLPGQDAYREISSVSNCGAFQSRRMKARFRREGEKQTEFLHMLNGSALAVGRTMVAVLENYQQQDGSIAIPEVLQPYMGGQTVIAA